jgi:hypothetical protein
MTKSVEKVVEIDNMRKGFLKGLQYQYSSKLKNMVDGNRHFELMTMETKNGNISET